jgi:hypothetical protein
VADPTDALRLGRPTGLDLLLGIARSLHEDFGAQLVSLEGGFPDGNATFQVRASAVSRLAEVRRARMGAVFVRHARHRYDRSVRREQTHIAVARRQVETVRAHVEHVRAQTVVVSANLQACGRKAGWQRVADQRSTPADELEEASGLDRLHQ